MGEAEQQRIAGSGTLWQPSGALSATNVTLQSVIARAYEVREFQVDGPGWLGSARFDIMARAPEGTPDRLRPAMLRSLLAERFKLGGMTMDNVAAAIAYAVDQAVVNRTGLEGTFDFELQFTLDTGATSGQLPPDAPSIFTAVQEQLGLRLEAARGPVQFLVIDGVSLPTPD